MEHIALELGLFGLDFGLCNLDLGLVGFVLGLELGLVSFSLTVVSSAAGLSSPSVTISGGQSLAFTAPSSPVHGPPAPAPAPASASAPQSPCLTSARPQVCAMGRVLVPESSCGTEVVQQRLDQTSTSLAAALKAVEKKLNQDGNSNR